MTADLQILDVTGAVWLPMLLVAETDEKGQKQPKTLRDAIQASRVGTPITDQLIELRADRFIRGIGLDYDAAYGLYTRGGIDVDGPEPEDEGASEESGGYVCPAGEVVEVDITTGVNAGPIVARAEYGGNLYFAQQGDGTANSGRVLSFASGGTTAAVSLALGANEYVRGLCTGPNGSGGTRLYAFSSDGGVQSGRVHEFDGSSWTSTAAATFGTNGRGPACTVMWRDREGIIYPRLVTISGQNTIAYTKPNASPLLAASWVEGVLLGTSYQLRDIAASRGHVWVSADDGVWDFDEVGNTYNLLSEAIGAVQPGNGHMILYADGSLYYSLGRGMTKLNPDAGILQEQPGQCAPGAFARGENPLKGYVTAGCVDMAGWVGVAVFNTTTRQSFVCWGKSREQLGIKSQNPLIFHGPEWFSKAGSDLRVTRMGLSALAGDLRLWVAAIKDTSPNTPRLFYQSQPLAGSPIQDLYSGGAWRCTTGATNADAVPFARLDLLPTTGGNRGSALSLHEHTFITRGPLDADTKLTLYVRADPAPGSASWGTGSDITDSPTQTLQEETTVEGSVIGRRIDFFAPDGSADPPTVPIFVAMWTTSWITAPQFGVRDLLVEYGKGAVDWENVSNGLGADVITTNLAALLGKRTTMRDAWNTEWAVRVMQAFTRETEIDPEGSGNQKYVQARIRLALLGVVS